MKKLLSIILAIALFVMPINSNQCFAQSNNINDTVISNSTFIDNRNFTDIDTNICKCKCFEDTTFNFSSKNLDDLVNNEWGSLSWALSKKIIKGCSYVTAGGCMLFLKLIIEFFKIIGRVIPGAVWILTGHDKCSKNLENCIIKNNELFTSLTKQIEKTNTCSSERVHLQSLVNEKNKIIDHLTNELLKLTNGTKPIHTAKQPK